MKKPLKKLKTIFLIIIILLIVAVVAINLYADRAVKWGIETAGTKTLDVGVKVNDVKLGILSGTLGLKNLIIDNPTEYQNPHMLELDEGHIQVKTGSLLSDVVKIKEIKLDGVNVVLEQGLTGNNIQDVIKNIPAEEKQAEEPSGKKLHIDILEISNIKVNFKPLPLPGKADTITVPLPSIKMTNLGNDNKLSTPRLVSKILVAITSSIAEHGAGKIPAEILSSLQDQLQQLGQLSETLLKEGKQATDELLKAGQDLGKKTKQIGENVGKEVKDITEGIKDLIKPKKEE